MAERLFVRLDDDPLYAPETSVPRGTLRELPVPAELRAWVAHVIAYEEDIPAGEPVRERVLPDGSLHLIFELDGGAAPSRVAGTRLKPATLLMQGRVRGLSVKLRPGAVPAFFGASAHELADRAVRWDDIAGAEHRHLPERLHDARGDERRLAVLAQGLQRMRRDPDAQAVRTARHAAQLLRGPGRLPVHAAAQAVGLGERRLQQLFQAHLGLSPRAWRRLGRMHECLRALRQGEPASWAALAADCGFSDQSHLINEFRALCGLTPAQFLRRSASDSCKTAA